MRAFGSIQKALDRYTCVEDAITQAELFRNNQLLLAGTQELIQDERLADAGNFRLPFQLLP